MIEFKNLTVETRHPIITSVDYSFNEGNIYGLVAVNGSGKTTIFRTMTGLLEPKIGQIIFDKEFVSQKKHEIFYFENNEWFDNNLTGMDYLKFVKDIWKSNKLINDIVDTFKMQDYINIPIKKYSLGMKQKLIISMYLLSDATYLIMDEITNGLDEDNRKIFFRELIELKKQKKLILISSHYKEEIEKYCDIVIFIKNEKLVEERIWILYVLIWKKFIKINLI